MVVIFFPATSPTMVWHDRTASPLTCTVQAPHRPAPQPNFVPVICNCSRIAQRSGVSFAASTDMLRPLMVSVGIGVFPCRCNEAAYGGNLCSGHPPDRRPPCPQE